ncbi:MAG: glycosyltransferase family 1 protein [Chloroflexota bacterium]|jgi:glycosyltransferase involved in cell wall biosynthesis|nr:glycosyltransferase family 1 protein [Chloroflexota bacterium]MDP6507647.1 glycosyltransferase family 1 protein [Chloroflexota bacterium]MDP6757543.1 glycosyltransferase family 1 protein [Chloroflexota bacterium]
MRVALDFTSGAWQIAGIGRATRGLVGGLIELGAPDLDLRSFYTGGRPSAIVRATFAGTRYRARRLPLPERVVLALWHKLRLPLPIELMTGAVDLVHSPDFVLPPARCDRAVVTVHDLTYVTHPETAHPAQKRYLDRVVPRSVERATRVIAVSAATRDDLVSEYGVAPEKIDVIHNGLDANFAVRPTGPQRRDARARFGLPERFVLAVGTIQPRKNLVRTAQAVAAARARGHDIHFVQVGAAGWLSEGVLGGLEEVGDGFVHRLGPVDDRWLPALYAEAEVTLAVSLAEGFMLPVIESMAMGTPVITSRVSCMPEIAGAAAELVDPLDVAEIGEAIVRVLDDRDLAERLTRAGEVRAGSFGWADSAAATYAIYRQVAEV